jgi:hypothetical protein
MHTWIRTALFSLLLASPHAFGHSGELSHLAAPILTVAKTEAAPTSNTTSGQGEFRFRILYRADHLHAAAQDVLKNAHGGFAVDRRDGRGEIYFALPGAGILRISSDFKEVRLLDTAEEMRDTNLHNAGIWYASEGAARLSFPANQVGKVFTTSLDGKLRHVLNAPDQDVSFNAETVNTYFREGGKFVPTDIEYADGRYYITTGYSKLDYVLTANAAANAISWAPLAFGGKGAEPGQFGTGHGITVAPDGGALSVSDRPNGEIDRFSFGGQYLDTLTLPKGAWPCDIDYEAGYALVGCLHGPDREKGAPIYLLKDGQVISTILPKEDLGLEKFQHVHNAVLVKRNGRLYIVAQAWNPGDFVILEQSTK